MKRLRWSVPSVATMGTSWQGVDRFNLASASHSARPGTDLYCRHALRGLVAAFNLATVAEAANIATVLTPVNAAAFVRAERQARPWNLMRPALMSLLRNELDVAILRPPVTDPRLQARRLMSEPYVLAVPEHHPLVERPRVRACDLDGESLVTLERRHGQYAHDLMMSWLAEHNVVPSRIHDAARHHAVMSMVAAGIAVALVPASAAAQPVKGVVYRRLADRDVPALELWIAFHKEIGNPLTLPFVEQAVDSAAHYRLDEAASARRHERAGNAWLVSMRQVLQGRSQGGTGQARLQTY